MQPTLQRYSYNFGVALRVNNRLQHDNIAVVAISRVILDGSGTANDNGPASGPPAIADMVNVAPVPSVIVLCTSEAAVTFALADKIVVPVPVILPNVWLPESTWNTDAVVEVDMAEAGSTWPVDANSSVPPLMTVGPW
jgi:hypothetical protein